KEGAGKLTTADVTAAGVTVNNGSMESGNVTVDALNINNGSSMTALDVAAGGVNVNNGSLTAAAVTADTFNLTTGSATVANLTGVSGSSSTATIGAGTTFLMTGTGRNITNWKDININADVGTTTTAIGNIGATDTVTMGTGTTVVNAADVSAGTMNVNVGTLKATSVTATNFNIVSTANVTGAVSATSTLVSAGGSLTAASHSGTDLTVNGTAQYVNGVSAGTTTVNYGGQLTAVGHTGGSLTVEGYAQYGTGSVPEYTFVGAPVTLTGAAVVGNGTVPAPATLNSGTLKADSLTIHDQGAVTLAAGSNTHVLYGLTFDGTPDAPLGKLDVQDGRLAIHYTDYQTYLDIQQNISASARWSADDLASMWDTGTGITSQLLTDSPNSGMALGYADNGSLDSLYQFGPEKPFGDYAIPEELMGATVLVRYTLIGDVNLDGVVNGDDIFMIVANYGMTGMDWQNGDVLAYDGVVGADDLFAAVSNYGLTVSGGMVGGLAPLDVGKLESGLGLGGGELSLSAVPEPATLGLMALGLAAMAARRRRAK
ncbi:MAG: PEP-CTERM sorting domain-containing protein, partial [Planctomycetota bacterium]|nr:PEP-CTERM sorting domain-containing protein [Planctomycetota bacterium]